MATLLQLQKKRDDAMAAVASATSDKARAKALSDLETTSLALAAFQTRIDSKTVKTVKKEERYEEEDEDEEEDEEEDEDASDEESDDEPKKPASDDSDDDDDDDADDEEDDEEDEDADEDEDEDEDEEEDEKAAASALHSARSLLASAKKSGSAKAIATARTHLQSVKRAIEPRSVSSYQKLKAACQRITGKKGLSAVLGALEALKATASSTEKLAGDVARIKQKNRREKVDAMLAKARSEGKITKAEIPTLRSKGVDDTRWLRSYLDATPKRVRSMEDGVLQGQAADGGQDGDARRASALEAQGLDPDQRKAIQQMADSAGKDFDSFFAEMQKTQTKANGAARRAQ